MATNTPSAASSTHKPIVDLIRLELHLLGTAPSDLNAVEAYGYAHRLDTEDLDPQVAHSLAGQLNLRMLALQQPFWHGAAIPARLHNAMIERAAAVNALLPSHIKRPQGFDDAPRDDALSIDALRTNPAETLDGWLR